MKIKEDYKYSCWIAALILLLLISINTADISASLKIIITLLQA